MDAQDAGCAAIYVLEFFTVDDVAVVNDGADFSKNEDLIKESAESCPVEVIKFE